MTPSPHTTRPVSHAEAREVARRLIAGGFRRDGERHGYDDAPRFSIPTRPDHDDDCLVMAYIEQREAADFVAANEMEELKLALARESDRADNLIGDLLTMPASEIAQLAARRERRDLLRAQLAISLPLALKELDELDAENGIDVEIDVESQAIAEAHAEATS